MDKDYNLLRLLIVLFQTRQTVAAARKLNISQPTVSTMLRKLRHQFNDDLFVRNKNKLEPTPKCQQLMERLPALVEEMEALYQDDKGWHISQMKGDITLVFPATLMAPIASKLITRLCEQAPNLTVNCEPWNAVTLSMLEQEPNYFGVGYLPLETNKNVMQKALPDDKFVLIKRKGHPIQSEALEEVLQYPLCLSIIPGYIEASKVEMLIKKYKLDKSISVRSADLALLFEIIKGSDALGVVSKRVEDLLGMDMVTQQLPPEVKSDTFRRETALFFHASNRHAGFINWLHSELDRLMS
ncbi:LysR family transcriptional regulator [Vibrio sp. SCSIO 43140]|uniref:LysR family transcriptional regulator n=1 Tax=Vibrio sp. SCSIO 43140 TaxID=2819100 RepID=UPI0020752534|nr:LysR family transcriptional regulator [Vibrio sp. SCSIO 43140]USD62817.1 LysR family transcriptional regulator [Vibrio sp. SCSIO 43140]